MSTPTVPRPACDGVAHQPVLDHARYGEAPAVLTAGAEISHGELDRLAAQRAASWGPGRRLVLIEFANDLDSLVAYLAALQHGHVALVVPDRRPAQTRAMMAAYDPDIVCAIQQSDDVRRRVSAHDLHPDLALLLSTSGTTGSPKLVRLSAENLASNAAAIAEALDLTPSDRAITSLPLHYCYGLSVLHSHLVAGASITLTDLSVVDECFWDLVVGTSATSFAGVPHTFELLGASGFVDRDLPSLRQVTQAGGRLAPEDVLAWSRRGQANGWDLVVMYGATEATARMAWMPPHLTQNHPSAIGAAIRGGELRLDTDADDRPGIGELVYSGPNVMLGYAEGPADLALGRVSTELRTGDLARQRDGLFEIVGRCNRNAKVFGLRLDLDAIEARLVSEIDRSARAVATHDTVHVFLPHGRTSAAARRLVAEVCGVPSHAVTTHVVAQLPQTATGKTDYAALSALAARGRTVPATRESVHADFVDVLARPQAGDQDTFVGLGGDSLSYVELATRLGAHFRDGLPSGWPVMPIGELARLAAAEAPPRADEAPWDHGQARRTIRGERIDTMVALRALAITFIVASHVDLVSLEGGAHLLLTLAGFNFARFQLSVPGGPATRLRYGVAALAQLLVPAALWVGGVAVLFGGYDLTTVLFLREWVDGTSWDDQWRLWFLEVLVWLTIAALVVTTVPALYRLERRTPWRFALGILALTAVARFLDVGLRAGAFERYTTLVVAFFFALGWAGARASTTAQRLLISAVAAALTIGFFGQPLRETIVLGGFLLMLWLPHLPAPSWLIRPAGVLASASLFIYLTHWQVYPPLEDAGHQWLALVASFAVGIGYARVIRPLNRAVSRAILRTRPGGPPSHVTPITMGTTHGRSQAR